MTYLYEALEKPTRLYIKQCPHCGLKYFGKSTREDIETYRGSGTKWENHLNLHNVKPVHLWNSDWYYDKSITKFAIRFSRLNRIVHSKMWANLKEEDGLDGGWEHVNSDENIRSRIHETKISKYGEDYMMLLVSEDVNQKREATCIEKYGTKNTMLSEEVRNKQKHTLFTNYGVHVPYKSEEIKNRGKRTLLERYGVNSPSQIPEVKEKRKGDWEIKRSNPEKYKKRHVNDGQKTIKIHYMAELPDGYVEGRLPNKKFSVTNGKDTITVSDVSEIPFGWYRGSSNKANKITINNGIEERRIAKDQEMPEGFVLGGISRKFYTDGKNTLRLKSGDHIPAGFYPGRTLSR